MAKLSKQILRLKFSINYLVRIFTHILWTGWNWIRLWHPIRNPLNRVNRKSFCSLEPCTPPASVDTVMAAGFEVQTKADSTRPEFAWLEENEWEAHGKQCYSCIFGPIKSAMNSCPYSHPHPSLSSEHFPWQAVLWRVSTTAEINNSENQWHHWWDWNWEQWADFTSQPNKRRGQPGFQPTVLANPPLCECYAGNVIRVEMKAWTVFRISKANSLYTELRVFKAAELSGRDCS